MSKVYLFLWQYVGCGVSNNQWQFVYLKKYNSDA